MQLTVSWSENGSVLLRSHVGRRTYVRTHDAETNGQPENIMPPAQLSDGRMHKNVKHRPTKDFPNPDSAQCDVYGMTNLVVGE